jgi:hypothetical protein
MLKIPKTNMVGTVCEHDKGGKGKVKFTLEQATKAQRGSRGIALLFVYPGTR